MSDIENKNVSDPLKHLMSLNFGRTSPVMDESALMSDDTDHFLPRLRRVRFAEFVLEEPCTPRAGSPIKELKGILKATPTLSENNVNLTENITNFAMVDYCDDISSVEEDFSGQDINSNGEETQDATEMFDEYHSTVVESTDTFMVDSPPFPTKPDTCIQETDVEVMELASFNSPHDSERHISEQLNTQESMDTDTLSQSENQSSSDDDQTIVPPFCKNNSSVEKLVNFESQRKYLKHEESIHSDNPKSHFCVIAVPNNEVDANKSNGKGVAVTSKLHQTKTSSPHPKGPPPSLQLKSADADRISDQTGKIKEYLKTEDIDYGSAKKLKSNVYRAWKKAKEEQEHFNSKENNTKPTTDKKTTIKPNDAADAYASWKQKKDRTLKKRKKDVEPSVASPTKVDSEENALVYKLWREKKDKERKERLRRKHKSEEEEKVNKLKAKEIQKQDAASAFNAWKEAKLKEEEEKKQLGVVEVEATKYKQEEKLERNKESQEAYLTWLEQKESQGETIPSVQHKAPWNPPG